MVDQRGWRGKIGVAVPATNTMVQPDFDDLRPDGVTNHVSRIAVPNMIIENDADFDRLIRICESELDGAVDRVMSVAPDVLVIGISSLLVWEGRAAAERRRDTLSRRTGLPVTGGSFAIAEALRQAGQKRIAVISPYPQIANDHITRFFADSGFEVTGFIGLHAPSPLAIADITACRLTEALDAVDSNAAEALIQFGTNMSFQRHALIDERKRGKPVHAINAATYRHALGLLPVPMAPAGG
ncbi:MAG: arylmalonate decarboxylase [Pseudomonadota bacterium]|nr:arylmalonate decarboxylase [Pseudomonadota bacterium]